MTIQEIKELVNQRIKENYTGDISARDVNTALIETLNHIGLSDAVLEDIKTVLTKNGSETNVKASKVSVNLTTELFDFDMLDQALEQISGYFELNNQRLHELERKTHKIELTQNNITLDDNVDIEGTLSVTDEITAHDLKMQTKDGEVSTKGALKALEDKTSAIRNLGKETQVQSDLRVKGALRIEDPGVGEDAEMKVGVNDEGDKIVLKLGSSTFGDDKVILRGVHTPEEDSDGVNKKYVDDAAGKYVKQTEHGIAVGLDNSAVTMENIPEDGPALHVGANGKGYLDFGFDNEWMAPGASTTTVLHSEGPMEIGGRKDIHICAPSGNVQVHTELEVDGNIKGKSDLLLDGDIDANNIGANKVIANGVDLGAALNKKVDTTVFNQALETLDAKVGQKNAEQDNKIIELEQKTQKQRYNASTRATMLEGDLNVNGDIIASNEIKAPNLEGDDITARAGLYVKGQNVGEKLPELDNRVTVLEQGGGSLLEYGNTFAEALTDTPEEASFISRQTAGGAAIKKGVAFLDKVKGNTLKVVQLLRPSMYGPGKTIGGITLSPSNDGTIKIEGVSTSDSFFHVVPYPYVANVEVSHNYLICGIPTISNTLGSYRLFRTASNAYTNTIVEAENNYLRIQIHTGQEVNLTLRPQVFDLTAMGMEDVTTPDQFAQRLGYNSIEELPYIDYTEGKLVSLTAKSIKSTGRNLWNEKWEVGTFSQTDGAKIAGPTLYRTVEPIKVNNNTEYCIRRDTTIATRIFYYNKDKVFITSQLLNGKIETFITPDECSYINFAYAYNAGLQKICLNISDPSFNGTYAPYRENSLPLPIASIKDEQGAPVFPYGLLSAGSVRDEIDLARGKALKRIGVVDLGSLKYGYNPSYGFYSSAKDISNIKHDTQGVNIIANIICAKFKSIDITITSGRQDKAIALGTQFLYISDSEFASSSTFETAMSGVMLYYELATPEEYDIPISKAFYKVENGGTETIETDTETAPIVAEIGYQGSIASQALNLL